MKKVPSYSRWFLDRKKAFFYLILAFGALFQCTVSSQESSKSAFVGETVILPCRIPLRDDLPTVEWIKDDSDVAYVYRDGCETFEMKHKNFKYRTSLLLTELKDGDVSLRISELQLSDGGTYKCKIVSSSKPNVVCTVRLSVGAVSEPKLRFLPNKDGGVSLQCLADCWFPEPTVTFLDDKGEEIKAQNPQRSQHESGCFTITKNVTLKTATNSVTCSVYEHRTNQTRKTLVFLPEGSMKSCTDNTVLVGCLTALFVAVLLIAVFLLHKYKVCRRTSTLNSGEAKSPPTQAAVVENVDQIRNASPSESDNRADSGSVLIDLDATTSAEATKPPQDIHHTALSTEGPLQAESSCLMNGITPPDDAGLSRSPSASFSQTGTIYRSNSLIKPRCNLEKLKRRNSLSGVSIGSFNSTTMPEDLGSLLENNDE